MISSDELPSLMGAKVNDPSGDKIGTVGQVYLDDISGAPQWVTVSTGLFGTKESFVPVTHADLVDGVLTVPVTKDAVKGAPQIDGDGHLAAEQEAELYQHYGLDHDAPAAGGDEVRTIPAPDDDRAGDDSHIDTDTDTDSHRDTDSDSRRDTASYIDSDAHSDSDTDSHRDTDAHVDAPAAGDSDPGRTGSPRLRRYVSTETQTIEVPVTREEFRVEYDEGDRGGQADRVDQADRDPDQPR